ncbi:MAG TPA: hypothetical protein PLR25_02050, partial [Planctomycetaceae bacterium]|nr:hypothetical protein [Planctomycetaceae bacterium]
RSATFIAARKEKKMPDTTFRIAELAIVGLDADSAFRDLIQTIRNCDTIQVVAEYETLSAALKSGLGESVAVDFVVVLQSYSDEFAQDEINALTGRLLFGRILCCYGPWCTADGRSHELWPATFRVPAASASVLLELELAAFQAGEQPMFPMSAGEEIFAHRSRFPPAEPLEFNKALVISNDFVLRKTAAEILGSLDCRATILSLAASSIRETIVHNADKNMLVLIDLDEPQNEVAECLSLLRDLLPTSVIVGLSVFAATIEGSGDKSVALNSPRPRTIIEKTELLPQLRQLLTSNTLKGTSENA